MLADVLVAGIKIVEAEEHSSGFPAAALGWRLDIMLVRRNTAYLSLRFGIVSILPYFVQANMFIIFDQQRDIRCMKEKEFARQFSFSLSSIRVPDNRTCRRDPGHQPEDSSTCTTPKPITPC